MCGAAKLLPVAVSVAAVAPGHLDIDARRAELDRRVGVEVERSGSLPACAATEKTEAYSEG